MLNYILEILTLEFQAKFDLCVFSITCETKCDFIHEKRTGIGSA
jgi:hypothetical protein